MQRMCVVLLGLFVVSGSSAYGQNTWVGRWFHHCHTIKERNTCWPKPFIDADRESVEEPFRLMVANGFRRQHLMSAHHFDGGKLNEAGRIKAVWLISQTPAHRHSIFVQRSLDPQETHDRIASVQDWANKISRGRPVSVMASDMAPRPSAGDRLDMINRKADETIPSPRIPASSGTLTGA
ncbi:MAG: hypothetical protein MI757_11725 [Pirellulales bacterium]|nr:hypothetical protein [Pirellulales bacterium]